MKKPKKWFSGAIVLPMAGLLFFGQAAFGASPGERRVIIGYKDKPGIAEKMALQKRKGRIQRHLNLINGVVAEIPAEEIAGLAADGAVEYVVEDSVIAAIGPEEMFSAEYERAWGVEHIGCPDVHGQGITGEGVRIAVLDSGLDYHHPDLAGRYRGGYDFVFNDEDPYDDSWNSHGTHVAGIIGANLDGFGVVGGAPDVSLYAVKVLDGAGFGLLSFLISGLEWAVANGMDIVNFSIAGPDSPALQAACNAATGAGVLLVAAAGNTRGGPVLYPGAYDSVIAVSAAGADDLPAYFSPSDSQVELIAPGISILSTIAGNHYAVLSGTSQAAPHVSAVAGLILSAGPDDLNRDGWVDSQDLRLLLQQSALDLGEPGRDVRSGFGLVQAEAALAPEEQTLFLVSAAGRVDDSQRLTVRDAIFEIALSSDLLMAVRMQIFTAGGGERVPVSTTTFPFTPRRPRQVSLMLDASGQTLELVFSPRGKSGNSATVVVSRLPAQN